MPYKKSRRRCDLDPATALGLAIIESPSVPATRPSSLPMRVACRIVRHMTTEMVMLIGDRVPLRRDMRHDVCHTRQISMYVCHVVLQISQTDIALAFGRDRSTVGHACHVVEDRRDEQAFDDFISAVERMVIAVFALSEVPAYA
jgi:hypothetical protein